MSNKTKYNYDIEFISFLASRGYHADDIAEMINIPSGSLVLFLRNNNIKIKSISDRVTTFQYEMIKDRYLSGKTVLQACEGFDISPRTINSLFNKHGVPLRNHSDYEKERKTPSDSAMAKEILNAYIEGESVLNVSKKFKISSERVKELVKEKGLMRQNYETRLMQLGISYNEDAFLDFDTDKTAQYFYGFMLADGNIRRGLDTVSITVKDTDRDILDKLCNYVIKTGREVKLSETPLDKRTGKIYKRATFNFAHKEIIKRLINQGFEPAKSGKEKLPKFDYMNSRDFWRGLIDGDGSIPAVGNTLILVGSFEVINGFISFLDANIGLITKRKAKVMNGKTLDYARVAITGQDAKNAIKFLYEDAHIYLDRKFELAKKYF